MEFTNDNIITEKRKFIHSLVFPAAFFILLWIIKLIENESGWDLYYLGIYPRKLSGLKGIIFSPLIHADFNHLVNNSFTLLVLSVALFYFYRPISYKIFFLIYIISGICVWTGGRAAFHIGASGIIYGIAAFIFFSGVIRRDTRLSAIALIIVFLYGSMIWGIFPLNPGISWESHLWGAIAGVILSVVYRKYGPPPVIYDLKDEDEENYEQIHENEPLS